MQSNDSSPHFVQYALTSQQHAFQGRESISLRLPRPLFVELDSDIVIVRLPIRKPLPRCPSHFNKAPRANDLPQTLKIRSRLRIVHQLHCIHQRKKEYGTSVTVHLDLGLRRHAEIGYAAEHLFGSEKWRVPPN